jgi:hypothetical protein
VAGRQSPGSAKILTCSSELIMPDSGSNFISPGGTSWAEIRDTHPDVRVLPWGA